MLPPRVYFRLRNPGLSDSADAIFSAVPGMDNVIEQDGKYLVTLKSGLIVQAFATAEQARAGDSDIDIPDSSLHGGDAPGTPAAPHRSAQGAFVTGTVALLAASVLGGRPLVGWLLDLYSSESVSVSPEPCVGPDGMLARVRDSVCDEFEGSASSLAEFVATKAPRECYIGGEIAPSKLSAIPTPQLLAILQSEESCETLAHLSHSVETDIRTELDIVAVVAFDDMQPPADDATPGTRPVQESAGAHRTTWVALGRDGSRRAVIDPAWLSLMTGLSKDEARGLRLRGGNWTAYAVQDSRDVVDIGTTFWQIDIGRGTVFPARKVSVEDCPWLGCKGRARADTNWIGREPDSWAYHEESSGQWRLLIHTTFNEDYHSHAHAVFKVTTEGDRKDRYNLFFPYRSTRFELASVDHTTSIPKSWVVSFLECSECDAVYRLGRIGVDHGGQWTTHTVNLTYEHCEEELNEILECQGRLSANEKSRHRIDQDTDGFEWDADTRTLKTPGNAAISLNGASSDEPAVIPHFNPEGAARTHLHHTQRNGPASRYIPVVADTPKEGVDTPATGADTKRICRFDSTTVRKCEEIRLAWELAVAVKSYCASAAGIEAQILHAAERSTCDQAVSTVESSYEGYQVCGQVLSECR